MWGGGLLFAIVLLNPFWDGLHDGFGLLLAAGFVGGHGTAAAIGATFAQNGWAEATSLAMTSATVGIISSILIGVPCYQKRFCKRAYVIACIVR